MCAGANIGVLAKIESAESVGNLNSILDAVDGAMVARGDLGAELPVEEARPSALSPDLDPLSLLEAASAPSCRPRWRASGNRALRPDTKSRP